MATIDVRFLQRHLLSVLLFCIAIESALSIVHSPVPSTCKTQPRVYREADTGNTILGGIEEDILSSNIQEFLKSNHSHLDHSHSSHSLSNYHINTSGIYLLNESVPFDGRILRIRAYGYFSDENILWDTYRNTKNNTDIYSFLFVVVYRINEKSSAYDLLHGPARISHNTISPGSLPTSSNMDQTLDWSIECGDKIGVFLPDDCVNGSDGNLMCPSHVNLIVGNESCLSAEYRFGGGSLADLDDVRIDSFEEVQLMLNLEVTMARLPVVTDSNNSLTTSVIVAVITSMLVIFTLVGITSLFFYLRRSKRNKTAFLTSGSTLFTRDEGEVETPMTQNSVHGIDLRSDDITVEANVVYGVRDSDNNMQQNIPQSAQGPTYNYISSVDNSLSIQEVGYYDDESPYWIPSNEERELMSQFSRLRIQSISHKDLEINVFLGSGVFGTVHKGVWHHSEGDESVEEEVAVKSIENEASEEEKVKFLQEAAIMGQFKHPNIVKIMGILVTESEHKIIMELMIKGDLASQLPRLKSSNKNNSELPPQLLCYSRQVANGMSYLSLKGYVHRDLAARNILISKDDICKIGDFGLSRDLNKEQFYKAHGGKIPVKWTAPEALQYYKFSIASDVWSYGCVLYEIWTLGIIPYHNLTNDQVMEEVAKGYRLAPPPGCPRVIYDIMIKCWNADPDSRPGFYEICSMLSLPESKILKWSHEDSETYNEQARTIGAPLEEGENMFIQLHESYLYY